MRPDLVIPVIVSNVLSIIILVAAAQAPRIARGIFGVGFVVAGLFNSYIALTNPRTYVDGFGPLAIGPYRDFIYGTFSDHVMWFILAIAFGQLAAGVLTSLPQRDWYRIGVAGVIVFLIGITGLGWGSGFPSTILLAGAAILCLRPVRMKQSTPNAGKLVARFP